MEEVSSEIDRISRQLAQKGYFVSFGIAARDKENGTLDMHGLVKEAESKMYAAKEEFYHQPGRNQRDRETKTIDKPRKN